MKSTKKILAALLAWTVLCAALPALAEKADGAASPRASAGSAQGGSQSEQEEPGKKAEAEDGSVSGRVVTPHNLDEPGSSDEEQAYASPCLVSSSAASEGCVKEGGTTLYAGSSASAGALTVIPEGAEVDVYSRDDKFAQVSYNGFSGFVSLDSLDLELEQDASGLAPAGSAAPAPGPEAYAGMELITKQAAVAKAFSALEGKYTLEKGWDVGFTALVTLGQTQDGEEAGGSPGPSYKIELFDSAGLPQGKVIINAYTGAISHISWKGGGTSGQE